MTMDPTQALRDIRENVRDVKAGAGHHAVEALVAGVEQLDDWMVCGGYAPEQWVSQTRIGRPRRTQDGDVILEGVEHGKRSSYNKGCRCLDCTAENRRAAARQRARIRESRNR